MEHIRAAARFAGITLNSDQIGQLHRYGDWLGTEGLRAGGIGPDELTRLEKRHLADSLLFAAYLDNPKTVWDLGSGLGLPGVPLAITLPDTRFVLIDRSGRRTDLLRRVLRILDLQNCEVTQGEIDDLEGEVEALVSRASLPPPRLRQLALDRLHPGGRAVVAGSWQRRPVYEGWETVEIPRDVLDQTVWLLIMRRA